MRDTLKFIGAETHLIGEDEVVSRATCALKRFVRLKEEVITVWVSDDPVGMGVQQEYTAFGLYFGNFGYEQTLPGLLPPFG